jgi:tryptophanyl-tRNA synthetase
MRVLSGIQPSGIPHIGNYFGMMRPAVELQEQGEAFLFIADYHSLTTQPKPDDLRKQVEGLAIDFMACGLDPEKTVFFRQSDVPQVAELTWILSTLTTVGVLERAHSYKDKIAKGFIPNSGLFIYPVLMASDILIYQSTLVPVGKDQKQHLEITRDLAIKFNNTYGDTFTIPEASIPAKVAVVPGVDGQKMSKSYDNTIPIFAGKKATRKTIMSIVTDCKELEEPKDPKKCNVVALFKLFADESQLKAMKDNYRAGNYGYGHAKQELFELMWEYFEPMRQRRDELADNLDYVWDVLSKGGQKASAEAEKTMIKVRKAVGLR